MSASLVASIQVLLLVLLRVLAVFLVAPVISTRSIPAQVKIGLAFFVALALYQSERVSLPMPLSLFALAGAALRETLIGALVGFVARLATAAAEMAGAIVDQQAGFRAATTMNPLTASTAANLEQMYFLAATLMFLIVDGHHALIVSLARTYEVIGVGGSIDLSASVAGEQLVSLVSMCLSTGCSIAMPVIAVTLILDVALAIVSRAVPQVQVFFLGMPIKIGVALALVAIVAPSTMVVLRRVIGTVPAQIAWLLQAL